MIPKIKSFLLSTFVFIIVISCKNEKKIESLIDPDLEYSLVNNSPYAFGEFNWNAAHDLKMELIMNLQLQKDSTDVLITDFIDKYFTLCEKV